MNEKIINLKFIEAREEVGNLKTFSFETGGLTWIPGQYQAYVLPSAGTKKEENLRYFTIASAPSEKKINITTRLSDSSFKKTLNALTTGDFIQVDGPKGDFFWNEETEKPVVLIAAGIGVTPFRSMLLQRKEDNQPLNATLIYFNRNEEIPFLDFFKQLEIDHREFKLILIVGEHVTSARILELIPKDNEQGTMYLSGPEEMVETIGEELKKQDIDLKQDWFPGYSSVNF